jgi:hypothetical protein
VKCPGSIHPIMKSILSFQGSKAKLFLLSSSFTIAEHQFKIKMKAQAKSQVKDSLPNFPKKIEAQTATHCLITTTTVTRDNIEFPTYELRILRQESTSNESSSSSQQTQTKTQETKRLKVHLGPLTLKSTLNRTIELSLTPTRLKMRVMRRKKNRTP